jgi:hypothetical protein
MSKELLSPVVIMSKHLKSSADANYDKTMFEIWTAAMNEYADLRAKPLVDALEELLRWEKAGKTLPKVDSHAMTIIKKALSAYKEGIDNNKNKEG